MNSPRGSEDSLGGGKVMIEVFSLNRKNTGPCMIVIRRLESEF